MTTFLPLHSSLASGRQHRPGVHGYILSFFSLFPFTWRLYMFLLLVLTPVEAVHLCCFFNPLFAFGRLVYLPSCLTPWALRRRRRALRLGSAHMSFLITHKNLFIMAAGKTQSCPVECNITPSSRVVIHVFCLHASLSPSFRWIGYLLELWVLRCS